MKTRSSIYMQHTNVDVSTYKGAKRVFIEAESGEYHLQIVVKTPAIPQNMRQFAAKAVEFQLYAVAA